jgi:hypothetical protein
MWLACLFEALGLQLGRFSRRQPLKGRPKRDELLRQAVSLFAHIADAECGNCEGTPCDDFRPRYVCKYHKWVAEAKAFLREIGHEGRTK